MPVHPKPKVNYTRIANAANNISRRDTINPEKAATFEKEGRILATRATANRQSFVAIPANQSPFGVDEIHTNPSTGADKFSPLQNEEGQDIGEFRMKQNLKDNTSTGIIRLYGTDKNGDPTKDSYTLPEKTAMSMVSKRSGKYSIDKGILANFLRQSEPYRTKQ